MTTGQLGWREVAAPAPVSIGSALKAIATAAGSIAVAGIVAAAAGVAVLAAASPALSELANLAALR